MRRTRLGLRVMAVALAVILFAVGAAMAAGRSGGRDRRFGTGGVAGYALPEALSKSHFGLVVEVSGGRLLVTVVYESDRSENHTVIERLEPDGSLDPSFGDEGSVSFAGSIDLLAEDPAGGVVYDGTYGLGRLEPDGARDQEFDRHARYNSATGIAFDSEGRILAVRTNPLGPRYHPHAGELEVLRFEADGQPDPSFGTKGVVYLGQAEEESGAIGLLSDGSIIVKGSALIHLAADGTVLPSFEEPNARERLTSLALFPDGSFAVAGRLPERPGCTITRYRPDGSIDQDFSTKTVFDDRAFACTLAAAPEGGLLVRELPETGEGEATQRLLLLTGEGKPVAGFGEEGIATVNAPAQSPGEPPALEDVTPAADGGVLASVGEETAVLVRLGSNGAVDPSFGQGGSIIQPATLPSWTKARAIAAEPDGELIVTGTTDSESYEQHPFWMRFTADGKLIPLSSGRQFAAIPFTPTDLRPAGDRYLYGLVETGKRRTYVAKFTRDGSLLDSFGREGLVPMPQGFETKSLAVGPNGGVTVVGNLEHARMAAYRVTAAGRAAAGFGKQGLVTVRFPGASESLAESGVLLPGGDMILGGLVEDRLAVAELGPDGRLRTAFGAKGLLTCRCGSAPPYKVELIAHRGHVYVLDHWKGPEVGEGDSLVKISPAGKIDRSFAGGGERSVKVGLPVALFARGDRLIVAGQKSLTGGPAQVREFSLDGLPTRSYGGGSRAFVAGGRGFRRRLPAALQPDGRIVFAGEPRSNKEFNGSRLELLGLH